MIEAAIFVRYHDIRGTFNLEMFIIEFVDYNRFAYHFDPTFGYDIMT